MISRMKEFAVDYAKRRVRRYLVSVGIGVVVVGAGVAQRTFMVDKASAAPVAPVVDARPAAPAATGADAARPVALQGEPSATPAAKPAGEPAKPVPAPAPQIGVPNIKDPISKAQKAADATNANIAAQTGQALPQRGGAPAPAPRSGPGSVPAVPVTAAPEVPGLAGVPPVTREVFAYSPDGRRDPFYSLILTEDLRPLLSDLKLVGILYEPSGKRSVAIMRDLQTNAQYRVSGGQTIGRMRVMQIKQKGVIFSIDEFGLSRQDSLVLTDTIKVRN